MNLHSKMSAFSDIFLSNRTPNNDNVNTLISDTYQIKFLFFFILNFKITFKFYF